MKENEQELEEFIRDICKVTPMSKSEARRRLDLIIHQAVAEERERVECVSYPPLPEMDQVKEEALLKNNTVNYELGFTHGANAMKVAVASLDITNKLQ